MLLRRAGCKIIEPPYIHLLLKRCLADMIYKNIPQDVILRKNRNRWLPAKTQDFCRWYLENEVQILFSDDKSESFDKNVRLRIYLSNVLVGARVEDAVNFIEKNISIAEWNQVKQKFRRAAHRESKNITSIEIYTKDLEKLKQIQLANGLSSVRDVIREILFEKNEEHLV